MNSPQHKSKLACFIYHTYCGIGWGLLASVVSFLILSMYAAFLNATENLGMLGDDRTLVSILVNVGGAIIFTTIMAAICTIIYYSAKGLVDLFYWARRNC